MAGRFSNIIPLRRSAILPGGLFTGKFNEVSCKVKNPRVEQEQVPLLPGKRVSVMFPAGIFNSLQCLLWRFFLRGVEFPPSAIQQNSRTKVMPNKTPMLSMTTSFAEGPRFATSVW